ncbi:MAG: hypothetical protein RIN56_15540 [Sporomusaceae bacterium]|nr:hypothetical protein [Sporomusaceae bacterium]
MNIVLFGALVKGMGLTDIDWGGRHPRERQGKHRRDKHQGLPGRYGSRSLTEKRPDILSGRF